MIVAFLAGAATLGFGILIGASIVQTTVKNMNTDRPNN